MSNPDLLIPIESGEKVKVNDHVYLGNHYSARDGLPYQIARIMEFLPPEGASNIRMKGKGKEIYSRVRINQYNRPGDVYERHWPDSRLLYASFMTDVVPLNFIRGKCYVRHKDMISDLTAWRKKPDRFYFSKVFEGYMKREFEVLPVRDIHNLPKYIKHILASRYDLIVTEKETIPEWTDNLRLCEYCGEWAPSLKSVQCASCNGHFHMACVKPPLLAKPSRGYGWTCAPCTLQREEETEENGITKTTRSALARPKPRPRKEKYTGANGVPLEDEPLRYYKMWPYRYFGAYLDAEDALEEEDFIYCRAPVRVGQKYQAVVGEMGTERRPADLPERGGEGTVEVLSTVCHMTPDQIEEVEGRRKTLRPTTDRTVDWLSELITRCSIAHANGQPFNTVTMKNPLRQRKWAKSETRYTDREWDDWEKQAFEDGTATYNAELYRLREEYLPNRPMPDIVRYFTLYKNAKLKEENKIHAASSTTVRRSFIPERPRVLNDDEESVIRVEPNSIRPGPCGSCKTSTSAVWYKAPRNLAYPALCSFCGIAYRKYGDANAKASREEVPSHKGKAQTGEKREGTPLTSTSNKRAKTTATTTTAATPTAPAPIIVPSKQLSCQLCKKSGPLGRVLKCKSCSLTAHAVVLGAVLSPDKAPDDWVCEICSNVKTMEASLDTTCLLCPRSEKTIPADKESDFLRACKPTEGQGWVHSLCALVIPEVSFSEASSMRAVEGISTVNPNRWLSPCALCKEIHGAVVKCGDCAKEFHPVCAFRAGYRLGFELLPVKNVRKDPSPIVVYKRETGAMNLHFWCSSHSTNGRKIYDLCDGNDIAESVVQLYARTYKQAAVENTHGLLRKARRLDHVLERAQAEEPPSESTDDTRCYLCKTEYSPYFHPVNVNPNNLTYMCHSCHFKTQTPTVVPMIS
ncbi:hypothetical protein SISNIDRAFT_452773 [Sistotremastrum niveocremeum HHB9708]|uniref:PHD-type domain-containing protein n=1 Tax=Sistotremastrum niveocremeum HHB9708 TaxID=1314777 RepID=A0A164W2I2_9AGAM|nr:hypothetical protein SISNIDRAFT_452773 [Sistotremastrum niveocremeum HHB9708]